MGFELDSFDEPKKDSKSNSTPETESESAERSASRINAEMYAYYEQMIKELMEKYPLTGDKLALALIMSRADKPTVSKNRQLSLIDVDKMLSIKNKSIKEGDMRLQNMRMAADLSGLKNNSFSRPRQPPIEQETESNRGNFQILRLVRAAQMHYFQATRRTGHENQEDAVNRSFNNDD